MNSLITTSSRNEISMVGVDTRTAVQGQGQVEQVTAKKKVNGFMGFRTYYSSIFSQFPQRGRSPLLTQLWRQDPFHNEWDFLCAVYSAIRSFLDEENLSFKDWINSAATHLGIISRDKYMEALGWQLERCDDGTNKLLRTMTSPIKNCIQPTNGLGLFNSCLSAGLQVNNARPIISKLSDPSFDVICMTTQPAYIPTRSRFATSPCKTNRKKAGTPSHAIPAFLPGTQCLPIVESDGVGIDEINGFFYPDYSQPYEALDTETFFAMHGSNIDAMLGTILNDENVGHPDISGSNDGSFFDMSLHIDCSALGKKICSTTDKNKLTMHVRL
ncbi:Mating-type protein MAT alpha 1 domain containing protein [Rhypophila sp. PSN 637]